MPFFLVATPPNGTDPGVLIELAVKIVRGLAALCALPLCLRCHERRASWAGVRAVLWAAPCPEGGSWTRACS